MSPCACKIICRHDVLSHAVCAQVLTADWCKYNDCVIATGSVDKSVKVWDVRAPERELTTLLGHTCGPGTDVIPFRV